jgi:ribosome-associated protein
MTDIPIGPDGIRLGQFLKYVNAVETGGDVKWLLESGVVSVNGACEIKRGRQLGVGDVVAVQDSSWRIVANNAVPR